MIGLWYRPPGSGSDYDPFFMVHSLRELVNFLPMQLSCLLAALMTVWKIPFPLLTATIVSTLWYMATDITITLAKGNGSLLSWVSMMFGVLCIFVAYELDKYIMETRRQQQQQQQQ